MSVIYPGDIRVPDAMHVAFQTMGVHPENGDDVSEEVAAAIEALPTADAEQADTRAHSEDDPTNAVEEAEKAAKKAAKK